MSDLDAKDGVEVAPSREHITELEHRHEEPLDIEGDIPATADHEGGEHDVHEAHRRLSDPQGKIRGRSDKPAIKGGGGGGSSRPGGGPKKDESDSDKSPEGPGESQGGTTEQPAPSSAGVEQPAPPKRKGKLRGKAAPNASKGAGGGKGGGLPGGAKT